MKKRTIELTDWELNEIINCVGSALARGDAYGMVTRSEESLAETNRKRLLAKLERMAR